MPEAPLGDFSGSIPGKNTLNYFRSVILDYYAAEGRNLAWRGTADFYHVLVSELMLQQTQVPRVEKKWNYFIQRFPNFKAVAAAPLQDLLDAWQGLGYNRRALALKRISEELSTPGSSLPETIEELERFPMIGPATARSISVFAFNKPELFIETNIRRVFIHFFFEGRTGVSDNEIMPIHKAALYREDPRKWYNALMDYGTHLAATTENANTRSTKYSRQSRFSGSFRQLRGAVLKSLGAKGPARPEDIEVPEGFSYDDMEACLAVLEKEGFLVCEKNGIYRIR